MRWNYFIIIAFISLSLKTYANDSIISTDKFSFGLKTYWIATGSTPNSFGGAGSENFCISGKLQNYNFELYAGPVLTHTEFDVKFNHTNLGFNTGVLYKIPVLNNCFFVNYDFHYFQSAVDINNYLILRTNFAFSTFSIGILLSISEKSNFFVSYGKGFSHPENSNYLKAYQPIYRFGFGLDINL
jgi:hypothetical protein